MKTYVIPGWELIKKFSLNQYRNIELLNVYICTIIKNRINDRRTENCNKKTYTSKLIKFRIFAICLHPLAG